MSEHLLVSESPTGGEAGGLCRCRTSASFQAVLLDELKAAAEDGQSSERRQFVTFGLFILIFQG